ncbi:MAG TPA: hypothetical protein PLV68_15875, partial [Ilumatobacteraceae bacterium]|nr:hypothetical protein [Ilumatobacteraceae bacterium]
MNETQQRPGAATELLILGGTVVDRRGEQRADVRVRDGRVTEVAEGLTADAGETVLDAAGCVVSPGFVDLHTHYDAQLFWDP